MKMISTILALTILCAACKDSANLIESAQVPPGGEAPKLSKEFLVKIGFRHMSEQHLEWKSVKCEEALKMLEIKISDLESGMGSDPFAPHYDVRKHGWHFIFTVVPDTTSEGSPMVEIEYNSTVDILAFPKGTRSESME